MRRIRILLIVIIGLLVVIGGAVAFLFTIDLNDYKETIAGIVERNTGRKLILDGRVDFDLGRQISLELTNARFANPEWAGEPYMARIARARLVIDLLSMIRGPIIVEQLELQDAELHLESLADGRNNWTFSMPTEPVSDAMRQEKSADNIFPLVLRHAKAQDFLFTLAHPALARRLEIRAADLDQAEGDDGLLGVALNATLNERAASVSGKYGPLANLVRARDLQLDISGTFDTLSILGRGLIDDLTRPRRPTVEFSVTGPAIDDVTEMLGLPDLGDGGLDLVASIQPDAEGVDVIVRGNLGQFTADVDASADQLLLFDHASLSASITGPSLGKAMQIFGVNGLPAEPFELAAKVVRDEKRLEIGAAQLSIGSMVFDLSGTLNDYLNLDDSHLELQVHGEDIEKFREIAGLPGAAKGPFQIHGSLNAREDGAELLTARIQTNIANLEVDGEIRGKAPGFLGTTLAFEGHGANLAEFTSAYGIPSVKQGPFSIAGAIELGDGSLATTEPVVFRFFDDAVSVEGTIGYQPLQRDTDVRVHASGQDLAEIAAIGGITEFIPAVPYDVSTAFTLDARSYRVQKLDARVGSNRLALDGVISKAAGLAGSRCEFSASGPRLNEFVADTEALNFAEGPFEISGRAELLADRVRLEGVTASVAGANATLDADIGLPLESAAGQFDVAAKGPNLRAVLPAGGRWTPPEAPFEYRARGKLTDGLWSFDELIAQIGAARQSGKGVFDSTTASSRTNFAVSTRIPDLSALGEIDGRHLPSTNVAADIVFAGSPDAFSIDPITAAIGDGDLRGSLKVALEEDIPDIELRLTSNLLDLDAIVPTPPGPGAPTDEPEKANGSSAAPAGGRIIPDQPIPLEQLKKLNARVDIEAQRIRFRGREYANLVVDGKIRDGSLILERANLITPEGSIAANMSLIPTAGSADLKTTLHGTEVYLSLAGQKTAEDIALSPRYKVDIDLSGSGLTLRDLAASVNGVVQVRTDGGRVPNANLGIFFGNFLTEVFAAVNPFAKKETHTEVRCMVVLLGVTNGEIAFQPGLVAQTDKMNIAATGKVSLATEKIDIGFRTAPRARVSISAGEFVNPYLKVAGTLGDPVLTLDPAGALVTGGAAVATAGLSLIATALWDRVFRADDPCAAAVEESLKDDKTKKKFLGIF